MSRRPVMLAAAVGCVTVALAIAPAPAAAFNPVKPLCTVAGWISGLVGKVCGVAQNGGRLLEAGKQLLSGHIGGAAKALAGAGAKKIGAAVGLTAIVAWVTGGAAAALKEVATLIGHTTDPQLQSTWFSSTYWRMAALAAVLTLPFLFAAAVQAVAASDLAMLLRAALGYLPLALLMVSIAAPLTMLLLAASDQMSSIVSAAAGGDGARSLLKAGVSIAGLAAFKGSEFLAFLTGLLIAIGAFIVWLELLIREAAVYVVVLMLPLAFAALAWPARRVWAIRAVEMLVALILAKFVIVAVLTLAAAGFGHSLLQGPSASIAGLALVTLAAFAPWALVRLLPMSEVASAAAGSIRREGTGLRLREAFAEGTAQRATEKTAALQASARAQADERREGREAARAAKEQLDHVQDPGVAVALPSGANGHEPESKGAAGAREPERAAGVAEERLPGMPAIWQQPDWSWPVTIGGPEGVPRADELDPRPPADEPDESPL